MQGLNIETFEIDSGSEYLVDSTDFSGTLVTVEPAEFLSATLSVDTTQTYSDGTFTFTFITTNEIP